MESILNNYQVFLDSVFEEIGGTGIAVDGYELDHIAYRPLTMELYEERKQELSSLGKIISEIDDSGRKICIIKLNEPLKYKNFVIPYFELLGPKAVNKYPEGYQHIEFVIDESLESFMGRYPNLNFNTAHIQGEINPSIELGLGDNLGVEFHLRDIGKVIELQDKAKEVLAH